MDYDVIVVGARVAGASTALLLARAGLRVLVVDQARVGTDTLSSHQVQVPGVALLRDWGLLDALSAAGTPGVSRLSFDTGTAVLEGAYPSHAGVDALLSPRRTLLDRLLVDAAREAGAEVRDGIVVDGLSTVDGRVTGVRATAKGGATQELRAALVVGADGKHSLVARSAGAREYRVSPPSSGACYAYFEDLPLKQGEVHTRPGRLVGAWPTNDGLSIVYLAMPRDRFDALRAMLKTDPAAAAAGMGDLPERLREARMVEHVRGTTDLPNLMRRPYGPGFVLVGDAGLVMDPITGQGISNALADAAAASEAIVAGLGGAAPLTTVLARYHRARDAARRPMYTMTVRVAKLRPDPGSDAVLFPAIAADPVQTSRFFGVLAGTVPANEFFAPGNLRRLVGLRGLARMVLRRPPA
jgi:2-polyprenyl-6-methoxyphenol hydroxylase-like FAD-dependent oxidoreductase